MSRWIDADALIERVTGNGLKPITEQIFHKLIDDAPTIDAVNVVYGEWIKRHGTINCSVCKRSNWSACFEDMVRSFNFCPNCGAKMKGADDGNK